MQFEVFEVLLWLFMPALHPLMTVVADVQKIDKELASALAVLEKEKQAALSDLDSQVDRLAADVLARVLPEGVKL